MTRSAALPLADVACCVPLVRQPLTAEAATDLARTLKAIADPARLRLLSMIAAHEGGEACVCDLTEPLGLSQPTVSHHLKVLVEAGLLTRDKRGVLAYFTLIPGARTPWPTCSAPRARKSGRRHRCGPEGQGTRRDRQRQWELGTTQACNAAQLPIPAPVRNEMFRPWR